MGKFLSYYLGLWIIFCWKEYNRYICCSSYNTRKTRTIPIYIDSLIHSYPAYSVN